MDRFLTGVIAMTAVIVLTLVGGFGGMVIGDRIEPMNTSFTGVSGPGAVLAGGFVGLIVGFAVGIWIAVRLLEAAKRQRGQESLTPKR